jgi:two-component system C4-dicarboxylate transport response regulator DctD
MPLFRRFLSEAATELKRDVPQLSAAVWRKLQEHEWPGNVRELRNFAGNVALGLGEARTRPSPIVDPTSSGLKASVAGYEADLIRAMLGKHSGDIAATITALDLPRKTFYDKLARHGIDPNDYRPSQQRQTKSA